MNDLQKSVGIFDKGGAAFNPVSVVQIKDPADLSDLGLVDVAADDAVEPLDFGGLRYRLFETADIPTASLTA